MMDRLLVGVMLVGLGATVNAEPVPLEDLMRFPNFQEMSLSPAGEYLAATVPDGDQTGIAILDIRDRADIRLSAAFRVDSDENAMGLRWAGDDRLIFTSSRKEGTLAMPSPTGRIYGIDADGRNARLLYGYTRGNVFRWANDVIHTLPDDPNHILINTFAHDQRGATARRLHIHVGRDRPAAASPFRSDDRGTGGFGADRQGEVRFAYGIDAELKQQLAWRPDVDSAWRTFDSPFNGAIDFWGFSEDGERVYVSSRDTHNLGVYRIHLESGEVVRLLGDDTFEPYAPIRSADGSELIGAVFATPYPEARFFQPEHPTARIWTQLQNTFPGYFVEVINFTRDGKLALVRARNDREPGIFLAFEVDEMRVSELVAAKPWIDPGRLGVRHPIRFTARDGVELHGYLTLPPGSDGENLPMVVEVHGGPHGPRDDWFYDNWAQAMATRGFAVLQVNFRGSGGRGEQFTTGAYRMWGAEMQDDITDATHWAIDQGIAHPDRVCISGASYGGYSTLVGLTREPDLYRCGFAFVGVYDLELAKRTGNIPGTRRGRTYLELALGSDEDSLRRRSPVHFVDRIRADLFVAHGAADHQAHFSHYDALIEALDDAGIPHERLLVPREGHGFYLLDNRVMLYQKALDFFDRNIGNGWQADGEGAR